MKEKRIENLWTATIIGWAIIAIAFIFVIFTYTSNRETRSMIKQGIEQNSALEFYTIYDGITDAKSNSVINFHENNIKPSKLNFNDAFEMLLGYLGIEIKHTQTQAYDMFWIQKKEKQE